MRPVIPALNLPTTHNTHNTPNTSAPDNTTRRYQGAAPPTARTVQLGYTYGGTTVRVVPQETFRPPQIVPGYRFDSIQLRELFKEHLLFSPTTADIELIANQITSEINTQLPKMIHGTRVVRYATTAQTPLHHLLFHRDAKGERVEILITPNLPHIGRGSNLIAYNAQFFTIPLASPYSPTKTPITYTPMVFKQVSDKVMGPDGIWSDSTPDQIQTAQNHVLKGIENQIKNSQVLDNATKTHLVAIPTILAMPNGKIGLEMMEPLYQGDLFNALGERTINQLTPREFVNLPLPTLVEGIRMIRETGLAVEKLHEQGLVHRDVRLENILKKMGVNEAVLSDFDTQHPIGKADSSEIKELKCATFVDTLTKNGWITPLCDAWQILSSLLFLVEPTMCEIAFKDPSKVKDERFRAFETYLKTQVNPIIDNKARDVKQSLNMMKSRLRANAVEANKQLIDELVTKHQSSLSEKEITILKGLPDDIDVIVSIFDAYCAAYKRTVHAWEFLKISPEVQQGLAIDLDKVPRNQYQWALDRKNDAIAKLEENSFSLRGVLIWMEQLINKLTRKNTDVML